MSDLLQDVRYALRLLLKQPGFTLVTIAVLALGIGATTAIFSVVDAVLLRPLPYANADRLVSVATYFQRSGVRGQLSAPDFHDIHDQASSFEGLAAYNRGEISVTVQNSAGDYAVVTRVMPEFYSLMAVKPQLGRLPSADEQRAGGPLTVVVSDAFWRSHLGGDAGALGKTLKYGDRIYTVVGVLTPEFRFPGDTDIWSAWWVIPETTSRSAHNYRAVGLLKSGVSVAQAQQELSTIAARLEKAYPTSNANKGVAVDLLLDQIVRNVRTTLNLIFAVVVTVLLIACANVSSLLLARATSRARELGIRAAVGATRRRVLRQLVTESVLLGLFSGAAGVLVAAWGVRALMALAPAGLPRAADVGMDVRVLAFAMILSLATSLVFGLVPAWQTSRVDLQEVLKATGRAAAGSGTRARAALIVFETAAAVVLVVGASLLIRSFSALTSVDLGFRPDHLFVANTSVPWADREGARRAARFYTDLLPQIRQVPGVEAASAVMGVPTQVRSNGGYVVEGGRTFEELGIRSPQALFTVATPDYFKTMGVGIARGRDFDDRDGDGAPFTAIINEALARATFPNVDPIGRRIATGLDNAIGPDGTRFMTIVGVARDIRSSDPSQPPQPQIFMPYLQHPTYATSLDIVARTTGDPRQLGHVVTDKVRALNADVPVRVTTMDDALGVAVSAPRFRAILLGLFAALALVLAMAGVYGIVSYTVSQRTNELGLRMALGAQRSEIVGMMLIGGLKLTALGVAAGWIVAFAASRVLSAMLFQVPDRDPVVFGLAPALLLAVAALASMAPALRASRVDPSVALRVE